MYQVCLYDQENKNLKIIHKDSNELFVYFLL